MTDRHSQAPTGWIVFAVLNGVASIILFCEEYAGRLGHLSWIEIAPVGLGVLVALMPSSVGLFVAFWIAYAWSLALGFPDNNTNQTLLFFVALSVLASAGLSVYRHGRDGFRADQLFAHFAPIVRLCVIGVYFWTAWDKVNWDFLNPDVSCAVTLGGQLAWQLGGWTVPPPMTAPTVAGTLLIESWLPVGLLIPRLRTPTVVLGVGFHWILGVAGYYGFSSTMIAVLSLFVTLHVAPWSAQQIRLHRLGLLIAVALMSVLGWIFEWPATRVMQDLWNILLPIAAGWWWWHRRGIAVRQERSSIRTDLSRASLAGVVPLALLLNGASPFLGFKTEYSFAMYSNLRTEGGQSNHLICTRPLALAPYQTDLVWVEPGSDPELLESFGGRPVPRYELTSTLWQLVHEDERTTIPLVVSDGRTRRRYDAVDVDEDASLWVVPPRPWERTLLRFRKIVPAEPGQCAH